MKYLLFVAAMIALGGCTSDPCQMPTPSKTHKLALGLSSYESIDEVSKKLNFDPGAACKVEPLKEVDLLHVAWKGYHGRARLIFFGGKLSRVYFEPEDQSFFNESELPSLSSKYEGGPKDHVIGDVRTSLAHGHNGNQSILVEDMRIEREMRKWVDLH